MKAPGDIIFSSRPPQPGHFLSGGSDNPWIFSVTWWHFRHWYSYIGTALLTPSSAGGPGSPRPSASVRYPSTILPDFSQYMSPPPPRGIGGIFSFSSGFSEIAH